MADGTPTAIPSDRQHSDPSTRTERNPGPRDGGFRIRLSDNEMRSARALQEAFGLRSTVAVLGFALRSLAQQLEEGKLDELVAQHRAQAPARSEGREGRRERPEGRGGGGGGGRFPEGRGQGGGRGGARVDPFARPPRPTAAPEPGEPDPSAVEASEPDTAASEPEITASEPDLAASEPVETEPVASGAGADQPEEAAAG